MRITTEKENHWLYNLENRTKENPYSLKELIEISKKTESNVKKLMRKYACETVISRSETNKLTIKFCWDKDYFLNVLSLNKENSQRSS